MVYYIIFHWNYIVGRGIYVNTLEAKCKVIAVVSLAKCWPLLASNIHILHAYSHSNRL